MIASSSIHGWYCFKAWMKSQCGMACTSQSLMQGIYASTSISQSWHMQHKAYLFSLCCWVLGSHSLTQSQALMSWNDEHEQPTFWMYWWWLANQPKDKESVQVLDWPEWMLTKQHWKQCSWRKLQVSDVHNINVRLMKVWCALVHDLRTGHVRQISSHRLFI